MPKKMYREKPLRTAVVVHIFFTFLYFFACEVRRLSIHICQCESKAFVFGAITVCARLCYNIFVAKHEKFRIENGKLAKSGGDGDRRRRPYNRICCQPIWVKMK